VTCAKPGPRRAGRSHLGSAIAGDERRADLLRLIAQAQAQGAESMAGVADAGAARPDATAPKRAVRWGPGRTCGA